MSDASTYPPLPMANPQGTDTEMLSKLQAETFAYFLDEINPANGLIADKTKKGWPSSIAVVGLALTSYLVGVEHGYISRKDAVKKTLATLRFFLSSRQGVDKDATGYKGFYYHFLDMQTGKRVWDCELSTIDTAILIAGILSAASYFTQHSSEESEIREIADTLYGRIDWQWALNGGTMLTNGWTPESGFIPFRWNNGYSEAHILYILALGSPTHPIDEAAYKEWISTFQCKKFYDIEYLHAGPLFIHQLSQIWLNFKGIQDLWNREYGFDYFENSRRAVIIQQQYAIANPSGFERYDKYCWGISACDGPGPAIYDLNGVQRTFYDYIARGVPDGPDDGTICPWAIVASLPFAPEIVLDTIRHAIEKLDLKRPNNRGFHASFNATFPERKHNKYGWVSPWQFGLNQGPVVLMIENYWSGFIWKNFHQCPYILEGIKRAGFTKI
jgi:hypothetical protein